MGGLAAHRLGSRQAILLSLLASGCGFQLNGAPDGAIPPDAADAAAAAADGSMDSDGATSDLPDAAPASGSDGACASLANADLASGCAQPGTGTCVDVVSCWSSCAGDFACETNCYASAKTPQYRSDAMSYIGCRAKAVALSGSCYASCQDGTPDGQARCIACLHVCVNDVLCRVSCSCGACAAPYAACYLDI